MAQHDVVAKINDKSARVVVIGIGYVGLPLVVEFARAGYQVTGYDKDEVKVRLLNAGESYIDYCLPWMFLPVFAYGLLVGAAYRFVARTIRHRELLVAYSTVTFWFALYLFERSWVMTLGSTVGLLVYVGVPVILLDRMLLDRHRRQQGDQALLFPQSDGVTF